MQHINDGAAAQARHWEQVYRQRGPAQVSWFRADPATSIDLIAAAAAGDRATAVIDVGGASLLSARLATGGFTDVTVLDVSEAALAVARRQDATGTVCFLHADLLTWRPGRHYRIWHDRAVLHFLTRAEDRAAYLGVLRQALDAGGHLILAMFAPDGPTRCSDLPVARYSADELAAELGGAFTVTSSRTERHQTPAGTVQSFTWITARATAGPR